MERKEGDPRPKRKRRKAALRSSLQAGIARRHLLVRFKASPADDTVDPAKRSRSHEGRPFGTGPAASESSGVRRPAASDRPASEGEECGSNDRPAEEPARCVLLVSCSVVHFLFLKFESRSGRSGNSAEYYTASPLSKQRENRRFAKKSRRIAAAGRNAPVTDHCQKAWAPMVA